MFLVNFVWFLFGLAIGFGAVLLVGIRMCNEELKTLERNTEFVKKYAEVTDKQYKNLSDYMEKQMGLLVKSFSEMTDMYDNLTTDHKDHMEALIEVVRKDHNVKGELINKLNTLVTEHEKINEERWSLITDYITNDGSERAEENHNNEDICDWCKNQRTEKCDHCTEPVSSTETYFVNYEAKEEEDDD